MPKPRTIPTAAALAALSFFVFTIWIVHEANIGRDNLLFQTVRATPHGDKIGHFFLAGTLTLALNSLLGHRCRQIGKLRLPYGSLAIAAIAILEESSQHYLPTRSLDIKDALANFAGILVFSIPALVWPRRKPSPQELVDDRQDGR